MPQQGAPSKGPRSERRPRRSARIRLVVLGTVTLSACGEPQDPAVSSRYVYSMRTDCVHDWGEQNCRDQSSPSSGYTHYYGPYYGSHVYLPSGQSVYTGSADQPAVHPTTGQKLGANSLSVKRGGFGSFFHGFRLGG